MVIKILIVMIIKNTQIFDYINERFNIHELVPMGVGPSEYRSECTSVCVEVELALYRNRNDSDKNIIDKR